LGAVSRDLHENERQYEAAYPGLDTSTGVKALLRDWTKLRLNAYDKGDYDALVLLIDLEAAMRRARLTDKQSEVLRLVYAEDLTQAKAAELLAIEQHTVSGYANNAATKIAKIYGKWARYERLQNEI
jgi:DNA-directed RNA polymerase specialized sigma24 family protein